MNIPYENLPPPQAEVPDAAWNEELGAFLRARRENLDPVRLGMPWIGVRRTPGLRREEVAQLAGIGITWYTKLEQGRSVRPSTKALLSIAEALQCTEAETRHLFSLAGLGTPPAATRPVCSQLSVSARRILDNLDPLPAVLQNAYFDIVGFNRAYSRLINVDLASVPPEDRNCIFLAFCNLGWRTCFEDWEAAKPRLVAMFRATMTERGKDPRWEQVLRRLLDASPEFRELWDRNEVSGVENHIKRFSNPQVGTLVMHQTNWWSAPRNGDRMMVYVPADAASEEALMRLVAM